MPLSKRDKNDAYARHLRDQAEADQVKRVRDNGRKVGLSRREVARRVGKVQRRFR